MEYYCIPSEHHLLVRRLGPQSTRLDDVVLHPTERPQGKHDTVVLRMVAQDVPQAIHIDRVIQVVNSGNQFKTIKHLVIVGWDLASLETLGAFTGRCETISLIFPTQEILDFTLHTAKPDQTMRVDSAEALTHIRMDSGGTNISSVNVENCDEFLSLKGVVHVPAIGPLPPAPDAAPAAGGTDPGRLRTLTIKRCPNMAMEEDDQDTQLLSGVESVFITRSLNVLPFLETLKDTLVTVEIDDALVGVVEFDGFKMLANLSIVDIGATDIHILDCRSLARLEINGCKKLETLIADHLPRLSSVLIQVSPVLEVVQLGDPQGIDPQASETPMCFVKGLPLLQRLKIGQTIMKHMTLFTLPQLRYVKLEDNCLQTLNFLGDLAKVDDMFVGYNFIKRLITKRLFNLHTLDCRGNEMPRLDLTHSQYLKYVYLGGNQINVLDLFTGRPDFTLEEVNFEYDYARLELKHGRHTARRKRVLTKVVCDFPNWLGFKTLYTGHKVENKDVSAALRAAHEVARGPA